MTLWNADCSRPVHWPSMVNDWPLNAAAAGEPDCAGGVLDLPDEHAAASPIVVAPTAMAAIVFLARAMIISPRLSGQAVQIAAPE
jgi:hypothetical protein